MIEKIKQQLIFEIHQINQNLRNVFSDIRKEINRNYSIDGSVSVKTQYGINFKDEAKILIVESTSKLTDLIIKNFPIIDLVQANEYSKIIINELLDSHIEFRKIEVNTAYNSDKDSKAFKGLFYGFLGGFFFPYLFIGVTFRITSDVFLFICLGIGLFSGLLSYSAIKKE